jgi:hypothetical protein
MKLELIEEELKTIRRLFDDVYASDISSTLQKYAIVLCLFDVILKRTEQNRDPKNFNDSVDDLNVSVPYFEEKLGLFVEYFGRHVHGYPIKGDWLEEAEFNLDKIFTRSKYVQLYPFSEPKPGSE